MLGRRSHTVATNLEIAHTWGKVESTARKTEDGEAHTGPGSPARLMETTAWMDGRTDAQDSAAASLLPTSQAPAAAVKRTGSCGHVLF